MKLLIFIAVVLAALTGAAFGGLYFIGWWLSPQDKLQPADAIVAISGGETNTRAQEAIQLYADGLAPKIIFSGAAADNGGPSNAEAMKKLAISQGVRPGDILLDEFSTNTEENALFTSRIVQQQGFHSIILVTSPYHQRRASLLFHWAMPNVTIINHSSIDHTWRRSDWWANSYSRGLTLSELEKDLFIMWGGQKAVQLSQQ